MIITRTPLRISFVGGGSDLPAFYNQSNGFVVSAAIDKYIYITINRKYDTGIKLSYSEQENVDNVNAIEHPIIKNCLLYNNIHHGIEITSIADLPSNSGLGSSSAFTVGLLKGIKAYKNEYQSLDVIAMNAYEIERKSSPSIGKQDYYPSFYGGLNAFTFYSDEMVRIEPLPINIKKFNSYLLLFDTGMRRNTQTLLRNQSELMKDTIAYANIRTLVYFAQLFKEELLKGNLDSAGNILHEAWKIKRKVIVSLDIIDNAYAIARNNGALGGKLCGAGNGGMLLIYAKPEYHTQIKRAIGLKHIPFMITNEGSKVIYCD